MFGQLAPSLRAAMTWPEAQFFSCKSNICCHVVCAVKNSVAFMTIATLLNSNICSDIYCSALCRSWLRNHRHSWDLHYTVSCNCSCMLSVYDVCVTGNMAYMDTMPDLMSETISMGTLGKQAEYDRRRRRKYVELLLTHVSCLMNAH